MGVFLCRSLRTGTRKSLPHARGGVSRRFFPPRLCDRSSPRTWGCFLTAPNPARAVTVFPTHVGVFPTSASMTLRNSSLPHARGGVSALEDELGRGKRSSPRTWGCFHSIYKLVKAVKVFPTHVGVFHNGITFTRASQGLTHARGGVSMVFDSSDRIDLSSPRTWGCFYSLDDTGGASPVFPTHVGVFLIKVSVFGKRTSLPHARGGVSAILLIPCCRIVSSPRTWGCF